jgi:hypothetical protein
LAYLTAHGLPGNLPRITGAAHRVVLGKIVPGRAWGGTGCEVRGAKHRVRGIR